MQLRNEAPIMAMGRRGLSTVCLERVDVVSAVLVVNYFLSAADIEE
jgi:hypothetical protein